jgi:hypothetical protein
LRVAGLLRFYLRAQAARHKGSAGEQHGSELGAAEGVLSGEMLGAGASIVYERCHLRVRPSFQHHARYTCENSIRVLSLLSIEHSSLWRTHALALARTH